MTKLSKTDRKTDKILSLLSGNVRKCKFSTDNDILPEKDLLEKAAKMKTFEYFPLGK